MGEEEKEEKKSIKEDMKKAITCMTKKQIIGEDRECWTCDLTNLCEYLYIQFKKNKEEL